MITAKHFASLLLLFFLSSCSRPGPRDLTGLPLSGSVPPLDSLQARAVFEGMKHFPNGTQISICIIRGDSDHYVGILRRNDSLLYVENSDSIFEIGSITKTFTGTMLAKLIRDGTVSEDDPVQKYLPFPLHQSSLQGKEMTLVDLADHTSGLPFEPTNVRNDMRHPFDQYAPYNTYDTTRLYEYLKNEEVLQSVPGERRTYSNLGGGLLGHLITLITKKSYEQYLTETVCIPLRMDHTFIDLTPERMRMMVRGQDPDGEPIPASGGDCGALTGCGGIKSSARDMAKYLHANMTDTTYFFLAQQPVKKFDEHFSGALGWAPYAERGKIHQGAYGSTGGYTCGVIFERQCKVGVVVLTNASAYLMKERDYTEQLCRALYDPLPFAVSAGQTP